MSSAGPLSHIRVLDLSRVMAGPWATQIFADLGADVIKVERPGAGDDTRAWGPPFLRDARGDPTSDSGYFLSVNRGKRSICLDLGEPKDREIVLSLAARSDILVENFKAGATARMGLDYAAISKINPAIIYASITGYGQTGPRSEQAAYDFMIQAMGGLMSVTGLPDEAPGGGPQKVGVPIVDIMTGMYTAVGVLGALANRERTGNGEYIDIAMLDVQAAFLANQAMNYLMSGTLPRRSGNRHPNIQPQDVFACSDGHVAVAVGNDRQFSTFCESLGLGDLASDARFTSNAGRVRNVAALHAAIGACFAQLHAGAIINKLELAGVPCAPINSVAAALDEPQLRHRQMVRSLPHKSAGQAPSVVSPIRYTAHPLAFERGAPILDEHRAEILALLDEAASPSSPAKVE